MQDCIFCKIIAGDIPTAKVYEDDQVLAFMDAFPAMVGHTLVIPKTHATNLYDAQWEHMAPVFEVVQNIGPAVTTGVGADGFRVLMNNGKAAGQTVFHPHVHIMPHKQGDTVAWEQIDRSIEELEQDAEQIRKSL